jgi:hypothetical protein
MGFRSSILAGTRLIRQAIQSPNFTAGVSGWSVNKDGSAEFNDVTIRNGEIISGEQLFYNGTPGVATLIASVAAAGGTDQYGNAFGAGICTYDQINGLFCQLNQGVILIGSYNHSTGLDTAEAAGLNAITGGTLKLESSAGVTQAAAMMVLNAGQQNQGSGSGLNPFVRLTDDGGTSAVDMGLSGAMVKADLFGAFTTWQAPSYAANFAAASTSGTYQALQYRFDAEDNDHFDGAFHTTASVASGTTIFTLPAAYRPKVARNIPLASDVGGTPATGSYILQINSNGPVKLLASAATATVQNFYVSGKFPLGNLS